jgi:hypothetical protein
MGNGYFGSSVIFGVVRSCGHGLKVLVLQRYEDGQLLQLTTIICTDIDDIFVFCGLLKVVNLIFWAFGRL